MSHRSVLEIAALASAAMPQLSVATTRGSEQFLTSGDRHDIVTAVITSIQGVEYDVSISETPEGKNLLKKRAKASYVLSHSSEPSSLSFDCEEYTHFTTGNPETSDTGNSAVYISPHADGGAIVLDTLTTEQCVAAGTIVAAIHRMRGNFLRAAHYPTYTADDIRQQLARWMNSLECDSRIPEEIVKNWKTIIDTQGLWDFTTCPVHGGFRSGDLLFSEVAVSAVKHWENMQINDPARDLAWIFVHLDKTRRNSFISAYSRIMGNRLDDMIWLRAGLWVQMEQVGDYMRAISNADTEKIMAFKAQVDSLAHQIARTNPSAASRKSPQSSTLTVGDLLNNPEAVQGKEETRLRGQFSHQASHTRFVVDSGQRSSTQVGTEASNNDATFVYSHSWQEDDITDITYERDIQQSEPSQMWNSIPSESEDFSFVSSQASGDESQGSDATTITLPAQSRIDLVENNDHNETKRDSGYIDKAMVRSLSLTSPSSPSAPANYVRVDENGMVIDDSQEEEYDDYEDDDTNESAFEQDNVETTIFAQQEISGQDQ